MPSKTLNEQKKKKNKHSERWGEKERKVQQLLSRREQAGDKEKR